MNRREFIEDLKDFTFGYARFNLEVLCVIGEVIVDTFSQGNNNTSSSTKDEYYIGKNYNDNMNIIETIKDLKR